MKESSKNFTEASTASHNNTSWYTETDGFIEHSGRGSLRYKGPALQVVIPLFGFPFEKYFRDLR